MSVYVDPDVPGAQLRQTLYEGNLVLLTKLPAVGRLVDHTREQLEKLFRPFDPEEAHEHFDKVEMARLLGAWKPSYIHSERAQALVCDIIREAGLPVPGTHYDLPKPRTSFPAGHLTTGIAYAFPWHRDTWYSAPRQQLNWWLPIYPVRADNAMTFDVGSFDRAVGNTSGSFDYYRNNVARLKTASQINSEEQARPAAPGHSAAQELVVLPAPGAVLLFAGAHLHASIPNASGRARYSVDFRTVDVADLEAGRGAPTVDVHCSGTAIRDFLDVADGSPFAEETVVRLFGPPPAEAMLVFEVQPSAAGDDPDGTNR